MNKNLKKFLIALTAFILVLYPMATAYAAKYTVVKNDSLYMIGKLFNTSVSELKTVNNLKSDTIYPGQKLEINAKTYTVKKGDTLSGIAKKYNISLTDLKKANNISGSMIKAGQKLIIPGAKTGSSASNASVIPFTNAELDLLARLIEAEATGESYNVKVAVGAVVVNRVQSKDWANSITGVINEKYGEYYQFTPVQNGMIKNPAGADSIKAAKEALNGMDPSKGAIYYYDNSSTNTWIKSKEVTARIGNMIFAK